MPEAQRHEVERVERSDDADLARRIAGSTRGSDPVAESELVRRYQRRLLAFGRRRLGSEDAAHDLSQQTLLLTLEKLRAGAVREPERIGAFILGIARTLVIERLRNREATHVPLQDEGPEAPGAPVLDDPLARRRIGPCLETLPESQRSVVVLSFYGELSSAEIGASLGLSHGNVRVLRHRGVAGLRDCLGLGGAA